MDWIDLEKLLIELAEFQGKKVQQSAQEIVPGLTSEDLLQPNDFPELENHPYFRYEEGVLAGILSVQTAIRCLKNSQ